MIFNSYPNLCETFKELAAWTNSTLNKSYRLGMAFNEETITEHILLELASRHSGRGLSIKAFTKSEEGSRKKGNIPTGADWAFWFVDSKNKGIELRIQAKRLFPSGKYESLDGNGPQINDLINNSGTAIPLYVFYNGLDCAKDKRWFNRIYKMSHCCFFNVSDWGCTYAAPQAIPHKKQPSPVDIKYMFPWHKLVCNGQSSLPEQVLVGIKLAYEEVSEQSANVLSDISAEQNAPEWVSLLDRQNIEELNVAIEKYLSENNLYGVVFIKEGSYA